MISLVRTIYADVLFLINFIINYLVLFTTSQIKTLQLKRLRLLLSALLGALYSFVLFFPKLALFTSLTAKAAISSLMVFAAFGKDDFLKNYLSFILVSVIFGGAVFTLALFDNSGFIETNNMAYYIHADTGVIAAACIITYFSVFLIFRRSASRSDRKTHKIVIKNKNREVSFTALHDTGNSLRAPHTNARVVICDYQTVQAVFSDEIQSVFKESPSVSFPLLLDKLSCFDKFSLVPYKTIGTSFSLLLAYRPDTVLLDGILCQDALIGISEVAVSDGGVYSALV